MQNELAKIMAVAFTIIAIVSELALIISGLMYDMSERVIVGAFGLIIIAPMIWAIWDDLRKTHA